MKAEPLKDKLKILGKEDFPPDMLHHYEVFDKDDVKVAVEWLKKNINEKSKWGQDYKFIKKNIVLKKIDEAFPDIK